MSTQSFADLGVSKAVVDALTERGITEPFQIQLDVIEDVAAGRDVLARSPTGSGKTLAFGVPLIDRIAAEARRPAALILAPTRELATQIVDELRPIAHARALRITAVYGGVGLQKQGLDAAKSHIIVATPGRLGRRGGASLHQRPGQPRARTGAAPRQHRRRAPLRRARTARRAHRRAGRRAEHQA
jgi:superfamily II DNA/RNA helicase